LPARFSGFAELETPLASFFRSALFLLFLVSCAERGQIILDPEAALVGDQVRVFIGTTRGRTEAGDFDGSRVDDLHFARFDVSVPPDRQSGQIKLPPRSGRIDPATQFLTTDERVYGNGADFRRDLSEALRAKGNEAVIFVHGFNTTFPEGLYRIAQLSHDLDLPGVVAHYSWPSAGQPLGYAYDRDSALFARDGLEKLIGEFERAGARRIILVAHSMGSALTMETLRQIALARNEAALSRIGGVVLISPDIDVDVFHAQAKSIPRLPQPFVVFTNERDRVLMLSARLSGQPERLGTLTDLSRVADLQVTFLDTAAFSSGAGHFNLGNSPSLIKLVDRIIQVNSALDADRAGRTGLFPGVVLTAQNATQIILSPVAAIGNAR
jgi:esterase/lipase superfamily enzyme